MDELAKRELDLCKVEAKASQEFREAIPDIVNQLVGSCRREDCFDHVGPEPLPSREAAIFSRNCFTAGCSFKAVLMAWSRERFPPASCPAAWGGPGAISSAAKNMAGSPACQNFCLICQP